MLFFVFVKSPSGFSQATGAGSPNDDMTWLVPKPLVYLTAMVVISPEAFAKQGEVLIDKELGERLDAFAGRKGFDARIVRAYDIVPDEIRSLQLAAFAGDSKKGPPWDGHKTLNPFVGWVIHYQPEVSDTTLTLDVRAAYAFVSHEHPAPAFYKKVRSFQNYEVFLTEFNEAFALPVGDKLKEVKMVTAHEKGTLHSGEILSTCLGEVEPGVHATCLTGVITRMPWETLDRGKIPKLVAPIDEGRPNQGMQNVLILQPRPAPPPSPAPPYLNDPELKSLSDRITELKRNLSATVDSLPANRDLMKLKIEEQLKLDEAIRNRDHAQVPLLRWRTGTIIRRMQGNYKDFESDKQEIRTLEQFLGNKVNAYSKRLDSLEK